MVCVEQKEKMENCLMLMFLCYMVKLITSGRYILKVNR